MATENSIQALFRQGKLSRRSFIALGSLSGLALAASTTAGCNLLGSTGSDGSQVIISRDEELQKSDTQNHINLINADLYRHIYDKLVERDAEGKIVPSLAESWEVSKDGLAWTFNLKKGVKFHNGESFTSQSVKATIERLKDKTLASAARWDGIDRVDTPSENVAVIRTTTPMGVMLPNLSNYAAEMLPPKALAEKGVAFFDNHIGTGPYKFVEWVKNERFVMQRFGDSWDKAAKIDKLVHRPILEEATRIAALRNGELDIAETIPPDQVTQLQGENKWNFIRVTAWDQLYLGLKCDQPPFNNKLARQAMNLAVDREAIVSKILLGGRPCVASVPQGMIGFHAGLNPPKYDPNKAKAMFQDAGYKGEKIRFIGPTAWYPKITEVEQALTSQFMASGLNIEFQALEGAAFTEARRAGTYGIYVTGAAQVDPGELLLQRVKLDIFKSGYKHDELFKLIDQGNLEVEDKKRQQVYEQAQQIMYDEAAPMIWLYQMEQIDALKKNIKGFVLDPSKRWHFRQAELVK